VLMTTDTGQLLLPEIVRGILSHRAESV